MDQNIRSHKITNKNQSHRTKIGWNRIKLRTNHIEYNEIQQEISSKRPMKKSSFSLARNRIQSTDIQHLDASTIFFAFSCILRIFYSQLYSTSLFFSILCAHTFLPFTSSFVYFALGILVYILSTFKKLTACNLLQNHKTNFSYTMHHATRWEWNF